MLRPPVYTPSTRHLLLICIIYFSSLSVLAQNTCRYPSGDVAEDDIRCFPDSQESPCCGPGFVCLSNGLCLDNSTIIDGHVGDSYYRGSCTDATWESTSCPNFCTALEGPYQGNQTGGEAIGRCPDTVTDKYYCKNSLAFGNGCDNLAVLFTISGTSPSPVTTVVPPATIVRPTTTVIITPSWILSTLSPGPTAIHPKSTMTNETQSAGNMGGKSEPYATRHSLAIGVGVGVGVGLPIGVALLILAGFIMRRKHQKDMELTEVYKGPRPVRPERPAVDSIDPSDHQETDLSRSRCSLIPYGGNHPPQSQRGLVLLPEDPTGQAFGHEHTWI